MEEFDPADLCRRLNSILQEERQARNSRRERVIKNSCLTSYHHVPQVAAKDFATTTAQDPLGKKDIHKLSRSVVKSYKLGSNVGASKSSGIRASHYREPSRPSMDILADRNQFQRSRAFEAAALRDRARAIVKSEPILDVGQPSILTHQAIHGWNSEGIADIDKANLEASFSKLSVKSLLDRNDRHDWTQRDECSNRRRRGFKVLIAPLIYHPHKRRNNATKLVHNFEENNNQSSS